MPQIKRIEQPRWLINRDRPEVLNIDFECFADPWNAEDLADRLRQRNVIGMVIERGEDVAGFMVYELHRDKLVLLRLGVHPAFQRQGFGSALIDRLQSKLSQQRRTCIETVVTERSLAAHLFLAANDFAGVHVERNFCGQGHDAYLFRHTLAVACEVPRWTNRITS